MIVLRASHFYCFSSNFSYSGSVSDQRRHAGHIIQGICITRFKFNRTGGSGRLRAATTKKDIVVHVPVTRRICYVIPETNRIFAILKIILV